MFARITQSLARPAQRPWSCLCIQFARARTLHIQSSAGDFLVQSQRSYDWLSWRNLNFAFIGTLSCCTPVSFAKLLSVDASAEEDTVISDQLETLFRKEMSSSSSLALCALLLAGGGPVRAAGFPTADTADRLFALFLSHLRHHLSACVVT
eukprot:EC721236.1.p1 GENE.EC721236.1~~EC721236.1.p1  ORF type:complete len:151 (+),score=11.97 EC721236.1:122-574(+)